MKIYEDSSIYVACPANKSSGGHETLHQLVSVLRDKNYDAYIFYYDSGKGQASVPEKFKEYNIEYVTHIVDNDKNIIVIPEVYTELIYKYKKIRKCIWFLSVDFYTKKLNSNRVNEILRKKNINNKIKSLVEPLVYLYLYISKKSIKQLKFNVDKNKNEYFYFYNCEYAKEFLIKNGIKEDRVEYLCGPISEEYRNIDINNINKRNIISYNPLKGGEFYTGLLNKIITERPDIEIVPIKDMTLIEIKELLCSTKVYMDFGFFPGPERIPREAVSCYCNIITSTEGSAKNDIDVPIPRKFKFDINNTSIEKIADCIYELVDNYDKYNDLYENYRIKVRNQRRLFRENIDKIFTLD